MKLFTALGIAAVSAAFSTSAAAQNSGWYVGASVGQANTKFTTSDFSSSGNGVAGVSDTQDGKDVALKGLVGYSFNQYIGAEVGYADLGKGNYKYSAPAGSGQISHDQSTWYVAVKGSLPITSSLDIFAKLGITENKTKMSGSTSNAAINTAFGLPISTSTTRSETLYGIGLQYALSKQISVVAEYEDFGKFGNQSNTGRSKVDLWSAGVIFKF